MRIIHTACACAVAGIVLIPNAGEAAGTCTATLSAVTLPAFNQIRGTPPVTVTPNVTVNWTAGSHNPKLSVTYSSTNGFLMKNGSNSVSYTVSGPNGSPPTAVYNAPLGGQVNSGSTGTFTFPLTITAPASQDPKTSSTPYSDATATLTCSVG